MDEEYDVEVVMPDGNRKIIKMSQNEYFGMPGFDYVFKNKGGFFETHQILHHETLQTIVNGIKSLVSKIRNTQPHFPEPFVGVISNTQLGASAGGYHGKYFIGINLGTHFLLLDLFFRMLSSPNVLTAYGNPIGEGITKKINFVANIDINDLRKEKEVDEDIVPKDPVRFILAQYLTTMAIKYLSIHEYGHIIFGHVDYKASLAEKGLKISPLDNQTLEYDADCYAAKIAFAELTYSLENLHDVRDELLPFFKSLDAVIFLWAFSVYSAYRLFQIQPVSSETLHLSYYPPVGLRQRIVFDIISPLLELGGYQKLISKVPEITQDVIVQVEQAFDEISNQGFCAGNIKFAFSPEASAHLAAIHNNWSNVRPLLEQFSFGKLPPITKI